MINPVPTFALINDQWVHPQRTGDRFLMEDFASLPQIRPVQLVHAQRCRLFLGVTTLADITDSNGRTLCHWALTGQHPPRSSIFHYPRQERPSPQVWSTWRQLLRATYCHTTERTLDTPLGPWHRGRIQQVWDSVIDPQTSLIYIWTDGRVRVYERKHRSNKQYRHLRPHGHNSFPAGCIPISGTFQSGNFVINGHAPIIPSPTTTSPYPVEMRLMNRGVLRASPKHTIAQSLWNGQAILGTDGSVNDNIATYSWVLSTTNEIIGPDVKGGGFLPSSAEHADHYSKRPEAAALYAGLHWIHDLLSRYPAHPPTNQHPTHPPYPH